MPEDQALPELASADRDSGDSMNRAAVPVSEAVQADTGFDSDQAPDSEADLRGSVQSPDDPLFQALQESAGFAELVLEASPLVDLNSMVVVLAADAWTLLTDLERNHLAMDWQELVLDFGYGELKLVDQDDRLLGRSARVGEGMILFETGPKP